MYLCEDGAGQSAAQVCVRFEWYALQRKYVPRVPIYQLVNVWLMRPYHLMTKYEINPASREKRGVCLSGEKCFGDLGCYSCIKKFSVYTPEEIDMEFYLYTAPNAAKQTIHYVQYDSDINSVNLDKSRNLWVIIHGFEGQWPLPWQELMTSALLAKVFTQF